MKKTYIIGIAAAALVVVLGGAGFFLATHAVDQAEANQKAVYEQYQTMQKNAADTALTIHEDGVVIGTYTTGQLGILPDVLANVEPCFTELERMEPAAFQGLSAKEKIQWNRETRSNSRSCALPLQNLDLTAVFADLDAVSRQAPQNAYVDFIDGSFLVHAEVPGTELDRTNVQNGIIGVLETMKARTEQPDQQRLELLDVNCYTLPQLTVENTFFNFPAMLEDSLQGMVVTVDFHGKTETLETEQLLELLYTDDKGKIQVHEDKLTAIVDAWWEAHQEPDTSYLFDSYVDGVIPIEFLHVDYEIDREALAEQLKDALVELKSVTLEPQWHCWRLGEPFDISGEYIEIDINNQTMTYFKDDEMVVTTPVVTGATWGYPTPEGLYDVDNKDTDCWLKGEDYNVHVDYWIGVVGYMIGIHDADWRTKFGGDNYVQNGSHGCINTPKEATKIIFDSVELGVPILVHGK